MRGLYSIEVNTRLAVEEVKVEETETPIIFVAQ
jgi:hypothetical protein